MNLIVILYILTKFAKLIYDFLEKSMLLNNILKNFTVLNVSYIACH